MNGWRQQLLVLTALVVKAETMAIGSEVTKQEDLIAELRSYRLFLEELSPADWRQAQTERHEAFLAAKPERPASPSMADSYVLSLARADPTGLVKVTGVGFECGGDHPSTAIVGAYSHFEVSAPY